jgi:hypothetical protein
MNKPKILISENPIHHWPDVNVKNKIVLDLGCGIWDIKALPAKYNTPEYFLRQGATQVVGVDKSSAQINFLQKYFLDKDIKNVTFEKKNIDSAKIVSELLTKYKIQTVKCDIEGAETCLLHLTQNNITPVCSWYVEYHSLKIKKELIDFFENKNYKLIEIGQHCDIRGKSLLPYGVIYFEKNGL